MRCPIIFLSCSTFLPLLSACTSPNDVICTDIALPAIAVIVRDSVSGSFGGNGATATAVDGSFSDTNGFPADYGQPEHPIGLAHERAGIYSVTVTKATYKSWSASGVRVTRDECHVKTVTLNARLQH